MNVTLFSIRRTIIMRVGLLSIVMTAFSVLDARGQVAREEPLIIDYRCTDITQIPESAIDQAKASLHIAYGHTSHGSQITSGMTGLVAFANAGGKGLSLPKDIFAWNHGGTGGALDLHDYAMGGDVGYYPQWVDNTRAYLNNSQNADVNVILWSWCSQAGDKYRFDTLLTEYLDPMEQLESDYANVTFVYMTGRVDHWYDSWTKAANQVIRDYCRAKNKVLYDFADIESHDPNGVYYPFPHENCDYYASLSGAWLGNWARQWQDSHSVNVDWYVCDSAHSEALSANQKAYAAWWLFARLGGWSGAACQSDHADPNDDGIANLSDPLVLNRRRLENP